MRITLSKPCGILFQAMIVLISMGLLFGCATPSAGPTGQEQITSAVHQPQGDEDLNTFWDEFNWTDFTPTEQTLWQTLGWNETTWQDEVNEPASESKHWSDLTTEERSAAKQLGYGEQYWDATLK